jgi:hypothetical protein
MQIAKENVRLCTISIEKSEENVMQSKNWQKNVHIKKFWKLKIYVVFIRVFNF